MSKMKVLSSTLSEISTIQNVVSCKKKEAINAENTLSFSLILDNETTGWINDTNIIELESDYYDIAKYKKGQSSGSNLIVDVDCEHISYRLNSKAYNVEYFTEIGTPAEIFAKILSGTPFSAGTIEFTESMTYSIQQAMSRRGLVVQFAELLGGELLFTGFTVSILTQRGSSTPKDLTAGRNVDVISKTVDKTTLDDNGNPTVSYECSLINPILLELGDVVTMGYAKLGIDITLRIVSIEKNPYDSSEVSFSVSNTAPTIEDAAYRIATETVSKDTKYNGCRIGPEYGFEAVRNDKKARAYFASDALKFQSGDGNGTWTDKIYFDPTSGKYIFDGELSATVVSALSALISPNLYAGKATIAEVTVDELDTSDKVKKYLENDITADNFQRIYDQFHEFITAAAQGAEENKVHATNRDGDLLYWTDDTHSAASATVTAYPVYTYKYAETAKMRLGFGDDPSGSGYQIPMIELGAGTGVDNNAKGFIYKGISGLYIDYYSTSGDLRRVLLSDDGIVLTPYALKSLDVYLNGFSAVYDADTVAMTWALDSYGRIVSLTAPDNVTIPVTWHSGDM